MRISLTSNLSDENWRAGLSRIVTVTDNNLQGERILGRLREKYLELQYDLKEVDLVEHKKQSLHFASYRCAVAILSWGQMDIIEDMFEHYYMLSHDSLIAGQTRIIGHILNNIVRYLLRVKSQKLDISPEEWYLENKDKLKWNETLQRVVLKNPDTTQNSDI